jgi:hypothetical protein
MSSFFTGELEIGFIVPAGRPAAIVKPGGHGFHVLSGRAGGIPGGCQIPNGLFQIPARPEGGDTMGNDLYAFSGFRIPGLRTALSDLNLKGAKTPQFDHPVPRQGALKLINKQIEDDPYFFPADIGSFAY